MVFFFFLVEVHFDVAVYGGRAGEWIVEAWCSGGLLVWRGGLSEVEGAEGAETFGWGHCELCELVVGAERNGVVVYRDIEAAKTHAANVWEARNLISPRSCHLVDIILSFLDLIGRPSRYILYVGSGGSEARVTSSEKIVQ